MRFDVTPIDREIYQEKLADFLPSRLIDVHTHVWLRSFVRDDPEAPSTRRTVSWPDRVAADNAIEDLLETYHLMFPDKMVTPVIFGSPRRDIDLEATNRYVSRSAQAYNLPGLLVSTPAWSAEHLAQKVRDGGFQGLKPYLNFAPPQIPAGEITIYDYLPPAHLEIADANRWVVMLHIPRAARLRDPLNLSQLLEIERAYPNVRLVVAHIGRAYCKEDVGEAFDVLKETARMHFDISANTNTWVMAELIRVVGAQRILFGSDLPILRMRMRRICEDGTYINLVPPGRYGDVGEDAHMREVSEEAGRHLTFFLYEEILAFREAAAATGLTTAEVADIFYHNAARCFDIA